VSDGAGWTAGEAIARDPRSRPDRPWWEGAVFYQIYPRSFLDTDGDGIGDLAGVRRRLPYLAQLGVDAIWLSPFYRSPMADFGYDVSDFCDVDPLFGTLDDARLLIAEAHEHGLRVIVDWVPHHTSSEHPWFVDARSSRSAAHRDWYVWRDPVGPEVPGREVPGPEVPGREVPARVVPGPPPNPWMSAFTGGPAWTWDHGTGQWYLHLFLPEQPDLEWHNPEVVAAMHDVVRFWLELGVDGFRVDVVHLLGKDVPTGPDPTGLPKDPQPTAYTHEILRDLRRLVDSYPRERMIVGEVYIMSTAAVAEFYGQGDELHLAFNFPPLYAPWEAAAWRKRIERVREELDPRRAWPTWVLSNHDNRRHRTRYGSAARARAAALLLLGVRGTPFLYAGEELGLSDAVVPADRVVDPGGRDGCRAPIPWDDSPDHGWAGGEPWLPWPPEAVGADAATQERDPTSVLHLYRHALGIRRRSAALRHGSFRWCDAPDGVLAWEREEGEDRIVVLVNLTDAPAVVTRVGGGDWRVALSSNPSVAQGWMFGGDLAPSEAVWLRPA
jgi:alpha-glucosidase